MSPAVVVTRGVVVAVLTVVAAPADDARTNARVPSPEDARRERINENPFCSGSGRRRLLVCESAARAAVPAGAKCAGLRGAELQRSPRPLDPRNEPPKVDSA